MPPVADLHVHTTNSDGTLTLQTLLEAARAAGLRAVAVTDHDRPHPGLDGPVTSRGGLTVIHGIELRVELESGHRIDLLGYALAPTTDLTALVERLQRERIERGAAIINRVESRLDVDLGFDAREGIGRPHIARAIAEHPDAAYDYQGAFDHLIGDGRPCYVPRWVPTFERGREVLADACTLAGLAHPMRYEDPPAALEHARRLDAVERWYPYQGTVDLAPVERTIAAHDLLPIGGSDAHDDSVGTTGLPRAAYDRVAARLPPPV